jgi:hypothetical protein
MGRWLHGDGKHTCGGHALFDQLTQKHAEFHRNAGAVADAVNSQEYERAEAMMASGTPYAKASTEVGEIAMRLQREIKSGAKSGAHKPAPSAPMRKPAAVPRAHAPASEPAMAAAAPAAKRSDDDWEEF